MQRCRLILLAVLLTAGCTIGGARTPAPEPGALPRLEGAQRSDPADVDAALLLAAAYQFAGRPDDASRVLDATQHRFPDEPGVTLARATLEEGAGNAARATELYRAYLDADPASVFAVDVGGRLERLEGAALREEVRAALAPGQPEAARRDPGAIVVLPLVNRTGDPDAAPFAAAVMELLAEDLSVTGELHAVDRARVMGVLPGIAPDASTWDDPALAEQVGRWFGADFVVQGSLTPDPAGGWQARGNLIPLGTRAGRIPFFLTTQPSALYTFAKQLALALYERTGIELTSSQRLAVENGPRVIETHGLEPTLAERTRVARGQSQVYAALDEFGRGVLAADAGEYEEAARRFERAARIDGGFLMARTRATRTRALAASAEPSRLLAWEAAQVGRQRREIAALTGGVPHRELLRALGAERRAVLAEILGQGLGRGTLLELDFVVVGP